MRLLLNTCRQNNLRRFLVIRNEPGNKQTFSGLKDWRTNRINKIRQNEIRLLSTSSVRESSYINSDKAIGFKGQSQSFTYTERDAILYALGVGAKVGQPDYLKFLFEGSKDFSVLPSYGVIPSMRSTFPLMVMEHNVPGIRMNLAKILHGDQYLEIYKPLLPSATLTSVPTLVDILDKKSGAIVVVETDTFDENNELVAFNQISYFEVDAGNFGGKRNSDKIKPTMNVPSRSPDSIIVDKTTMEQAALYRLSGDNNPLHIDPEFAAKGGLATPILHGLCTFGHATRHVLQQYAGNDVTKFKAIKVRFTKPVLPGQTICTEMWKEGNRIHFQCKVPESGNIVISNAYIDLMLE
ncbi:peroxisomal multifunctional enzyme type 2-like [Glandiceps talaboti]